MKVRTAGGSGAPPDFAFAISAATAGATAPAPSAFRATTLSLSSAFRATIASLSGVERARMRRTESAKRDRDGGWARLATGMGSEAGMRMTCFAVSSASSSDGWRGEVTIREFAWMRSGAPGGARPTRRGSAAAGRPCGARFPVFSWFPCSTHAHSAWGPVRWLERPRAGAAAPPSRPAYSGRAGPTPSQSSASRAMRWTSGLSSSRAADQTSTRDGALCTRSDSAASSRAHASSS